MKSYRATATREDGWWIIRIPELDRITQAKRLDQAEYMARDLIALWLEVPADSFTVTLEPILDDATRRAADEVQALQAAAARAAEKASRELRIFAANLLKQGYTVRDAGRILEVSPQRISQLTSTTATKPAKVSRTAAGSKSTAGSALVRSATKSTASKANPRGTKTTTPAQSRMVMTRFKDGKTKGTR